MLQSTFDDSLNVPVITARRGGRIYFFASNEARVRKSAKSRDQFGSQISLQFIREVGRLNLELLPLQPSTKSG